jgi:putative peptidoglycan lipid II flippase
MQETSPEYAATYVESRRMKSEMATGCIGSIPAEESQPGTPKRKGSLLRHTFVYAAASLFAYALSMVKAVVVGRLFGTTPEMDAYALAILLPNLIGALVSSTTAGALVPTLAKAAEESEEARATVFRSSLAILATISLFVTLLIALFATPLAHLVGAAFDPYRLTLTARMLRWASALVVLTGVYAVCSAELLARKRYWAVGLSPALGTATSLAMIWSFSKPGIDVLAWSLVVGAVVQAVVLVVPAWDASRGGSVGRWNNVHVTHSLVAQFSLLGAAMIGVANSFVDQAFATWLPSGSISALNYAGSFNTIAMQVVVMALGWVALPDFSALAAGGKLEQLRTRVRRAVVLAAMLAAPASLGVFTFGREAIRLVFEHGRFDTHSTAAVFTTWGAYTVGLVPAAMGMVIVRLINAIGKNALLFRIGMLLLVANAVLDYVFMRLWGLLGISLSTSFVYLISCVVLFVVVRAQVGRVVDRRTVLLVTNAILCAAISVIPIVAWRAFSVGTIAVTMLQVLLFLSLLIATYSMTRLLSFQWSGFRGVSRIPFHLALEKN